MDYQIPHTDQKRPHIPQIRKLNTTTATDHKHDHSILPTTDTLSWMTGLVVVHFISLHSVIPHTADNPLDLEFVSIIEIYSKYTEKKV
jgi:hypothetical protein